MRGFLFGLVLIAIVVVSVLSFRPGGLRNQLRNVGRRLKLALLLGGAYLLLSGVLRLAFPDTLGEQLASAGAGLVLAVVFLVLGRDRQYDA